MKTVSITAPEGFEFEKVENGKIIFKEVKKVVTYEDVAKEMFFHKEAYFVLGDSSIAELDTSNGYRSADASNAATSRQLEKLLAMNKLMNVAKWLNPTGEKGKYGLHLKDNGNIDFILNSHAYGLPIFINPIVAVRAIKILGEDVVKLALTNDY